MKIAYVIAEDISVVSGVLKKIEAKIKYWKLYGHEVSLISLKSNSMISVIDEGIILSQFVKEKNFKKKFLRRFTISKKLNNYLLHFQPDVIYSRFIGNSPDIAHIFKKHAPYIVEVNTNDLEEFKIGGISRYMLNIFSRDYFFSGAKAFVSVSEELMLNKVFTKFKKKFIVIGNGYDFDNTSTHIKQNFNDKPVFIFMGTPRQVWHGLDKIIKLANRLNNTFHIIGPTKDELKNYKQKNNNIIFHGYRDKEYIEKLILKCDIGISTLALHRKNMQEASSLKSREYLAYGLPIILGYVDTDLPNNFKFSLNIGNYENNVLDNIDRIKIFANSFKNTNPAVIIQNSKKYLDYKEKEKKRINFIHKVLEGNIE